MLNSNKPCSAHITKPTYTSVLEDLDLPDALEMFDATVIGTPPLDIHTQDSDIDIACYAHDPDQFISTIRSLFGEYKDFTISQELVRSVPSTICNFHHMQWEVELFAQAVPVNRQYGVRHFFMEKRLLELLGDNIKLRIIDLKMNGLKTEPAFAHILGIEGDPYVELLRLETMADSELVAMAEKQNSSH